MARELERLQRDEEAAALSKKQRAAALMAEVGLTVCFTANYAGAVDFRL